MAENVECGCGVFGRNSDTLVSCAFLLAGGKLPLISRTLVE